MFIRFKTPFEHPTLDWKTFQAIQAFPGIRDALYFFFNEIGGTIAECADFSGSPEIRATLAVALLESLGIVHWEDGRIAIKSEEEAWKLAFELAYRTSRLPTC